MITSGRRSAKQKKSYRISSVSFFHFNMRVGIFGGTFNPIHSGHAMVINYMSQHGGFDEIWIMVNQRNPLKNNNEEASGADRIKMAEIVASKFSNVKVSDFEFQLPTPSYTINTLLALKKSFPEESFRLIIGTDNWQNISQWKDYNKIITDFGLVVYKRPGYSFISDKVSDNVKFVSDCPSMDISSTFIRKAAENGENLNYLVPCEISDYIKQKGLYRIK